MHSGAERPASGGSGLFARLRRTRERLLDGLRGLVGPGAALDEAWLERLQEALIVADLGVETADLLIGELRREIRRGHVTEASAVVSALTARLVQTLNVSPPEVASPPPGYPRVMLMTGVNGVGKTTTAAKLAARVRGEGRSVILAAADTYRAAAIEQLQVWGGRLGVPVVAREHGADPASVAHDAWHAAKNRSCDVLIIDTAGRQHVKDDLMAQLGKVKRVLSRLDATAPHDVLLVVDAATGQNVLSQIDRFHQTIPLTGLCVTKLDGTARGGVIVAAVARFGVPVRYLGVGEAVEDLRDFDPGEYVRAMIPPELTATP